ncbi:hypothetical protein V8G54_010392 [Vigna mungo]|uniref:Uncharacterized protein n=1 Tax=Vigna mungo TaxID=3915 RepID=A0AAQ3NXY5_VIGMU
MHKPAVVSHNMLKVKRLESTMLPYCVFISKILIHFEVDCVSESKDEDAGESSSIPYRPLSEFDKAILKEIRYLKIICQGKRQDVSKIREHLNLNNQNEEEAAEDESSGEGSTPKESAAEEMHEDESEDEDVAEESNSDMLLRTYLKKKSKKRI